MLFEELESHQEMLLDSNPARFILDSVLLNYSDGFLVFPFIVSILAIYTLILSVPAKQWLFSILTLAFTLAVWVYPGLMAIPLSSESFGLSERNSLNQILIYHHKEPIPEHQSITRIDIAIATTLAEHTIDKAKDVNKMLDLLGVNHSVRPGLALALSQMHMQ